MKDYPNLFTTAIWYGNTDVQFELLDSPPEPSLIGNINIVPYVGDKWLALCLADGSWEIPGGTVEAGESVSKALERELLEEAGARLIRHWPLGAWKCHSHAEKPYKPYYPHPLSYRYVVVGEVQLVDRPTNPADGELVASVYQVTLKEAVERFRSIGRDDLAELYQLAAMKRNFDDM